MHEEQGGGANRGADDGQQAAEQGAEQQAAGHGQHGRFGHRKRDRDRVDRHVERRRGERMGFDPDAQCCLVAREGGPTDLLCQAAGPSGRDSREQKAKRPESAEQAHGTSM